MNVTILRVSIKHILVEDINSQPTEYYDKTMNDKRCLQYYLCGICR